MFLWGRTTLLALYSSGSDLPMSHGVMQTSREFCGDLGFPEFKIVWSNNAQASINFWHVKDIDSSGVLRIMQMINSSAFA